MRALCLCLGLTLCLAPPLRGDEAPKKAEAKTYQVPYRLTETKHILVRAKINGKGPYNFIIDTGAPALFVATGVCTKLGIERGGDGWATFDRFEIEGGVVLHKARGRVETPFQLEGMNGMGLAGAELHGIIGYTVLARYRLGFDFTRDKLTWTPLNYEPPAPQGLGEGAKAPQNLDMMGGMMKAVGAFLGRKAEPEVTLRGFLGLELADADGAATVKAVLADSPAAKAGLKVGDRITAFRDETIKGTADLLKHAAKLARGDSAELTVERGGGKSESITIRAGEGL
jgi:hypothetical protein